MTWCFPIMVLYLLTTLFLGDIGKKTYIHRIFSSDEIEDCNKTFMKDNMTVMQASFIKCSTQTRPFVCMVS